MNRTVINAMREKRREVARKSLATENTRPESSIFDEEDAINPRRKRFADAILLGENKAEAARQGDYCPTAQSQVTRHDDIKAYLERARSEITNLTTISRLDILNIFLEAVDMARTLADPGQMIAGAREIGKMMGFYEPERLKVEISGDMVAAAARYQEMSDEELLNIAANNAKVVEGETVQ